MSKKNQIIYLNGPSSSGKSALVSALQQVLKQPYLHIGIDKVIGMMPNKLNNWEGGPAPQGFSWKAIKDAEGSPMQELQMGPFAKKISKTYKEIVLTLAKLGHFIVIDDVAFGKKEVDQWRSVLRRYKVLYIGVYSPLKIIEQRERKRENRMIGSARAQFNKVHKDVTYDLIIDTHKKTMEENVEKIVSFN